MRIQNARATAWYVTQLLSRGEAPAIELNPKGTAFWVSSVDRYRVDVLELGQRAAYYDDWDEWLWQYTIPSAEIGTEPVDALNRFGE